MTPEQSAELDSASIPFISGAITQEHTRMRPWRVFLEINSACNLKCPTCTKGNMAGYDHETGIMHLDLMGQILDKLVNENNQCIVFLYGNSEPMLHPRLAECIAAVKSRGLRCELSTNLNHVHHLDEMLAARPDFIIISLSGFTQEVYVKGHAGGQIEKVKANMRLLSSAHERAEHKTTIMVNYHIYKDNEHELELMREYAGSLGIGLFTSFARAISMENAIQYCRSKDPEVTPFEVQPGRPDWNHALPPISKTYVDTMERLKIPPTMAREMYAHHDLRKTCPIGTMFSFVRHDGKTELCACVADRRITLGDFLETSQDQLMEQRYNHAICQQCQKYKLSLYFHLADREKWGG